jgi:glutamate/tyrosine decarboxylase-like PLP-dependent enzyme
VLALRSRYQFRVHVDAAYGGYFTLAGNLAADAAQAFARISEADSIVVDPHKHGLQPYGCGCILFRDPALGRFYKHDSPYTYFTSSELHLGEISLECSRAGASAVALWATQQLLPLIPDGEFARGLESSREAAMLLHQKLNADGRFIAPFPPELDIVVFAVRAATVGESSRLAQEIFAAAEKENLYLALTQLPVIFFPRQTWGGQAHPSTITCLRSVLMKPEHLSWLDRIFTILNRAASQVLS